MNIRNVMVLFCLVLVHCSLTSAEVQQPLEIAHSKIQRLMLWVQPGEQLNVSFSRICDAPGATCTIFVDRGAKLVVSQSTLGAGLTIYHRDSALDALEMKQTKINAKLIAEAPSYADSLNRDRPEQERLTKDLHHSKLQTFSGRIENGKRLETFWTELCLEQSGPSCPIIVEPGGQVKFSHTKLGDRVDITSTLTLATGLSFLHTDYPYPPGNALDAKAEISAEDSRLLSALSKQSLKAQSTPRGVVIELPDVYFEFDKSSLTPEAASNVAKIALIVNSVNERPLAVEGHADSMGSETYNLRLSSSRAAVVRDALIRHGVSSARIGSQGYGESRPVSENSTDEGRARNRRVEIVVERTESLSRTNQETQNLNRAAEPKKMISAESSVLD